jgi:iron complex transport system permease protein
MSSGGIALQGVFRNALADPSLIGVTGGALLGAALAVVVGGEVALPDAFRPWLMTLSAFAGALVTTLAVKSVARGSSRAGLVLAGIAVNAVVASLCGFLFLLSDDAQLRALTMWSMGGLGGAGWTPALVACGITAVSSIVLWRERHALDLLLLGESSAVSSGLSLPRLQWKVMLAVAASVGAVTAATGLVGFIGLIVPHVLRLLLGPRHGRLFVGGLAAGPILVLGADLFARWAVAPVEIPLGVVMSGLGGPALLFLLTRKKV